MHTRCHAHAHANTHTHTHTDGLTETHTQTHIHTHTPRGAAGAQTWPGPVADAACAEPGVQLALAANQPACSGKCTVEACMPDTSCTRRSMDWAQFE